MSPVHLVKLPNARSIINTDSNGAGSSLPVRSKSDRLRCDDLRRTTHLDYAENGTDNHYFLTIQL